MITTLEKRLELFLVLLICFIAAGSFAITIYLGSITTVNNTTVYGNTNTLSSYVITPPVFSVTNTGLTATTALTCYYQLSFDSTNFFTVASFQCPQTNPGTYPWNIGQVSQPAYSRIQITTTNSVMVGIFGP